MKPFKVKGSAPRNVSEVHNQETGYKFSWADIFEWSGKFGFLNFLKCASYPLNSYFVMLNKSNNE